MTFPTGRKNREGGVSNCPKSSLRLLIPVPVQEGVRGELSNRSAGVSGFWSSMDSTGVLKSDWPAGRRDAGATAALAQPRQYRSKLRRLGIVFVSSLKSRPDGWQELVRNSWNGTRADRLWPTGSFDPSAIKIGGPSAVPGRQPRGSHGPSP